ncbi:MAG: DNA cytosine methyltransferase [Pseudomonadota bacterium]
MRKLEAYEFFCGGGMARLGLGPGWRVTLANDMDAAKCAAYRANFGEEDLIEGDIHDLTPADLPGRADLAWASFPCQDLSLAGKRGGLTARRSAAFWGFHALIEALRAEGRAPRTLVIENVVGFATSRGGADLALALGALAALGYRYDVRIVDAAAFLPQSRPRLFIIAWLAPARAMGEIASDLSAKLAALPDEARAALHPLPLSPTPRANMALSQVVETDAPVFGDDQTRALLTMMSETQRAKLDEAKARAARTCAPVYGAGFRRMRSGAQRLEARFDIAGCLRTPAGGSSRQLLLIVEPNGTVSARRMTPREAARLMGLPESYELPASETQALKLSGDGVAVPVVRWIVNELVAPLLRGSLEPAAAAE